MKDLIRKQRIFFVSLIGIVVVSLALVTTYAYQTLGVDVEEGSNENLSIKAGVLDVSFTSTRRINLNNMPLLSDYTTSDYMEFVVDNTKSTEDVLYNIKLIDLDYSASLITKDFKYTVVRVNDDGTTNILSDSDFSNLDGTEYVLNNNYGNFIFIEKGKTQKIRVYLWLNETIENQNYLENSYFKGLIELDSYFAKDTQDRVITNFKIYGNKKQENNNIEFLGKLMNKSTDKYYGKYKIDLVANSNNLFKTEDLFIKENDNWVYQTIYLKKGTYRINYLSKDFNYIMVKDNNDNKVVNEQVYTENFEIKEDNYYKVYIGDINNKYVFSQKSTPSSYQAMLVNVNDTIDITKYEPYIEPVTYSIYLDEPLRCINETCDYIDFIDNKIFRKIDVLELTGEEEWTLENNIFSINIPFNTSSAISTHFTYSIDNTNNTFNIINNKLNIISNDNTDLETFKNWLKENKVKIYYILNENKEENISSVNLREFVLKNINVTDGNINASNIEIGYNK